MKRKYVFSAVFLCFLGGALARLGKAPARPLSDKALSSVAPRLPEASSPEATLAGATSLDEAIAREKTAAATLFRNYYRFKRKAILSAHERDEYRETLSDETLIDESRRILMASQERTIDLDTQELRMSMVQYLAHALDWPENPARELVLRVASEVMDRDVRDLALPLLLKKSLAGDQIELFEIVANADPALALQIQERNQNGPNSRWIAYAIALNTKGSVQ